MNCIILMSWFNKAQSMELQNVRKILDTNTYNGIDAIRDALQRVVPNYCEVLALLCDGQEVPPFYMTVWQQLCSPGEIVENAQPEIEQNENVKT